MPQNESIERDSAETVKPVKVAIRLDGGLVHEVFPSIPGVEVFVIDTDTEGADLDELSSVRITLPDGHEISIPEACVGGDGGILMESAEVLP